MESQINRPLCFIKGELIINGERKAFGYQANEIQAICTECMNMYEQIVLHGQCGIKEDDDPCEDFLPKYFKDTTKYIYINNKWFQSTMGEIKEG